MEKDYENQNERLRQRDKYIEEKYPELKNLSRKEIANYYTDFMKEYFKLDTSQYVKMFKRNLIGEYEVLKKKLDFLVSSDLITLEINKRKNGSVGISMVFDILVSNPKATDLVGKLMAEIILKYDDYLLQVVEKDKMRFSFDVELCDKIPVKDYEDELNELELKMKYLISKKCK